MKSYATYDEFQEILQKEENAAYRLVYKTIWYLGLLVSEVLNIRREDIDEKNNLIKIRSRVLQYNKQKKPRYLPSDLKWALLEYCNERHIKPKTKLFNIHRSTIYKRLGSLGRTEDGKPFHPHSLRKGAGRWFIERGGTLERVQTIYGHKDIRVTYNYLGLDKDDSQSSIIVTELDKPEEPKPLDRRKDIEELMQTLFSKVDQYLKEDKDFKRKLVLLLSQMRDSQQISQEAFDKINAKYRLL
ncbi:MAG: tyrosine-type recombinase/integrase [Nitrososphaerales archaeon]